MTTKTTGKRPTIQRKKDSDTDVRAAQTAMQKAYLVHSLVQATYRQLQAQPPWSMNSALDVPHPFPTQAWGGAQNRTPAGFQTWGVPQQPFPFQ